MRRSQPDPLEWFTVSLTAVLILGAFALLLTACPGPKAVDEAVAHNISPGYPHDDSEAALREATPDDSQFPFDPEGTNCPDNQE